jgi:hypothetical protein
VRWPVVVTKETLYVYCCKINLSVSIKVKMSDSDEDPEITSELKKGGFNVTNCSNRYFNFHFDKSLLCRIRTAGCKKNGNCQNKIDTFLQFFHSVKPSYGR